MKRIISALALLALAALSASAQLSLAGIKVNGLVSPVGINPQEAAFSWNVISDRNNTIQVAYEISVSSNGKPIWKSGHVLSDECLNVPFGGRLESDTKYDWTLKVWDGDGRASKMVRSSFRTGILPHEWECNWIGHPKTYEGIVPTPVYFRKEKTIGKKIKSAVAYISAQGVYEAKINGVKVGDDYLTPGWTSYHKRIQYQGYDVTSALKAGDNEINVLVCPGWYASGLLWGGVMNRVRYGKDLALIMQVSIEYADGTKEVFGTDGNWEISFTGPVTDATIYDGETVNHNIGYAWETAIPMDLATANLCPSVAEPVRVRTVIKPVRYIVTPKGEKVIDFGQNLVGWERVSLKGAQGDTIRIDHAEVLDGAGNFYTESLRSAKAASTFVLKGEGTETFEPCHTFYGFRFIRVEGVEGDLNLDDFEAVAADSGFDRTGGFSCSNPTINQLQSNIYWGFRGNFLEVPTDCPQRDERLGWTGDAEVFYRTATFLGGVQNFTAKWLADMRADQCSNGGIPVIIPDLFGNDPENSYAAGWSDACTIIPWQHYQAFADKSILEDNYEMMKAWADFMVAKSEDNGYLYNMMTQPYGDWLYFRSTGSDNSGRFPVTSRQMVAQCYFGATLDIVAKTAGIIGNAADAEKYSELSRKVKKAFCDEYVSPQVRVDADTQTDYVLALYYDMLPEDSRPVAAQRLADAVVRYDYHIMTGFLGTPHICEVLSRYGYDDLAYILLLQETCPSWIYPVKLGATTIWERWNSIKPDGTIMSGMNSFNHYSYGAIGDWMYRYMVGIRETTPGYRTFVVEPHYGGGFEWAEASTKCPYGEIKASWKATDGTISTLDVTVPVGTTATVTTPSGKIETVGSGVWHWNK